MTYLKFLCYFLKLWIYYSFIKSLRCSLFPCSVSCLILLLGSRVFHASRLISRPLIALALTAPAVLLKTYSRSTMFVQTAGNNRPLLTGYLYKYNLYNYRTCTSTFTTAGALAKMRTARLRFAGRRNEILHFPRCFIFISSAMESSTYPVVCIVRT